MKEFYPILSRNNAFKSPQTNEVEFIHHLEAAFLARQPLLSNAHTAALRLFNGFYEGLPGLIVDLYGKSLLISNHAKNPQSLQDQIAWANNFYSANLTWLESILLKERHSPAAPGSHGVFLYGATLPESIQENGVRYALNLRLNQDDSFYLDTRNLRVFLKENLDGKILLNFFAYTGTLGIAALAGGARRVIQTDLNERTLSLARQSEKFNTTSGSQKLLAMDFFKAASRFKSSGELFDCVILDPPLFSTSQTGNVDLLHNWVNLINKARPLVGHEGWLVVVNNALFLSGKEVTDQLATLERSGYVHVEKLIDVPADVMGFPQTILAKPPSDPAPFNHPTKIAVLRILRKDGRFASEKT